MTSLQAAEQHQMDASLATRRTKRKAPAPPNPFTGEVERTPLVADGGEVARQRRLPVLTVSRYRG